MRSDAVSDESAPEEFGAYARQQAAVALLGQSALHGGDLAKLFDQAATLVAQTLEVEFCEVLELGRDGGNLLLRAGAGWHEGLVGSLRLEAEANWLAGYTLISERPVIVGGFATERRFRLSPLLVNHHAKSGVTVTIEGSTSRFGVLGAFSTHARQFGGNDVRFLQSVANVIGLAVRNENIRQEQIRRAELFQTAIENVHDLVTLIAPEDGRIMFASASVERVTGYRPEEVVGQTVYDFFAGSDANRREAIRRVLADPESMCASHITRHRDGSERVLETRVNWLRSGTERRFVVFSSCDVTDRVRAERELARARDAALEGSRIKSTFIANTSHEIRTPLNVILGYTEVIGDELSEREDAGLRSYLEAMRRAGRRLLHTIDVILDYSKAEAGGIDLNPVEIELGPFLENLVCDFDVLAAAKRLDFVCRIEAPGATVRFDERCLASAVSALLQNAIKFTEYGEVSVRLYRDNSGDLKLEIRDSGVGIDPEYLRRLFEPFSQEQSSCARPFEGNGLALALARKQLELNGATVTVESAKSKGSTFTINFPQAVSSRAASAGPATPQTG